MNDKQGTPGLASLRQRSNLNNNQWYNLVDTGTALADLVDIIADLPTSLTSL